MCCFGTVPAEALEVPPSTAATTATLIQIRLLFIALSLYRTL
jgi:hypothetical protein